MLTSAAALPLCTRSDVEEKTGLFTSPHAVAAAHASRARRAKASLRTPAAQPRPMLGIVRSFLDNNIADATISDSSEHKRINASYARMVERKAAIDHPVRAPLNAHQGYFEKQKDAAGPAGSKYRATLNSRANCYSSVLAIVEAELEPRRGNNDDEE